MPRNPLKLQFKYDLDAPERTDEHRAIILNKRFLKRLYTKWYNDFQQNIKTLPEGKVLELGSGGGFFKELEPSIITSDLLDLPWVDMSFSALEMPFDNNELSGICMIDTFHHIPDSSKFLKEVMRVLKPGGVLLMVEPANSLWGRFIYRNFHHEPFNPDGNWMIPPSGPLSGANGALPWIVFERDRDRLQQEFPGLTVEGLEYHTPLRYLVSGGVSYKQLVPNFSYGLMTWVDNALSSISNQLSMFTTITVRKTQL